MQRQRDGLVPIGEALADLPGPVQALIPSSSAPSGDGGDGAESDSTMGRASCSPNQKLARRASFWNRARRWTSPLSRIR